MAAPAEDALMDTLGGGSSRTSSDLLGRTADLAKRPPTWAAIVGGLAMVTWKL